MKTHFLVAACLLSIMLCPFSMIYGQQASNNPHPYSLEVIPPTPTPGSLGKYLDIPVNYQTGTPQIEIPIFTIKGKQLSVPISLSYHASGLKVDDYASWVGAGWSLNAGGNISRTIRGLPDEFANGGLFNQAYYATHQITYPFNTDGSINSYYVGGAGCNLPTGCGDGPFITYHNRMQALANGCFDSEPDLYFFSLPTGKSGRFLFDPNNRKPYFIPHQPVIVNNPFESINYSANVNYADYSKIWVITDENGIEYTFGKYESRTAVDMNTAMKNYNRSCTLNSAPSDQITTWHLLKMYSKQYNETIEFFYADEGMEYDMEGVYTTYEKIGFDIHQAPAPSPIYSSQIIKSKTKRLSQITTSFGYEVNFGASHQRQDVRPFQGTTYSYALTNVEVSYNGSVIKNMQMSYDYSLVDLTLKQIQELPLSGGETIPPYQFFYKSGTRPQKYNQSTGFRPLKDPWGFAKYANEGKSVYYDNYIAPILTQSNYISYNVDASGYAQNPDPLHFDFAAASSGMLEKVQYPTGGYSEITYEPYTTSSTGYKGTHLLPINKRIYQKTNQDQTQTATFTVTGTKDVIVFRNTPCGMQGHPYCSVQLYRVNANNSRTLVGDFSWNPLTGQQAFTTLTSGTYELQVRLVAYDCQQVAGQCNCPPQNRGEVTLTPPNCANTYEGEMIKVAIVAYEPITIAKPVGGHIRVKEINYHNTNTIKAFSRSYKYLQPSIGSGQGITFIERAYQLVHRCTIEEPQFPTEYRALDAKTYKGKMTNVTPGAPLIAYQEVEVMNQILDGEGYYDENLQMFIPPTALNNGKSVYFYNPIGGYIGLADVSENAKMTKQIDYKVTWNGSTPTYQKVKEQLFTYGYESFYHHNTQTSISSTGKTISNFRIKNGALQHSLGWCEYWNPAEGYFPAYVPEIPTVMDVSRWHVLKESVEKIYDPSNESKVLTTTTTYTYDSKNALPNNVVKTLNNGESISQITKFSSNSAGNATGTMLQRNILSLPLEQQSSRKLPNGTLEEPQNYILSATKTEYRVEQDMILPSKVYMHEGLSQGILPNYVLKAEMDSYDDKGNVLSYHAVDGNRKSYLWSVTGPIFRNSLGRLPIAEVLEASDNQIAFTSFESPSEHWNYTAGTGTYLSTDSKTGLNAYILEGARTISKTGLPSGTYQVSFWVKGTSYQINLNGQNISPITANVRADGWELKQVTFTGTSANISITSGSCLVDELRLHPVGARMSTYTYHTSGGFLTVSDPNQRIVYYEYDGFNRLKLIRDEERNILKTFYYNYKQN